ncbi:MAG: hypothetical protein WD068_00050 [Candidatus Babeliales bacterium]
MKNTTDVTHNFTGNIFIFQAFDIGDEIDLEKIKVHQPLPTLPLALPKYFKEYHLPLGIELPQPHDQPTYHSSTLHHFGVISLVYKIPFQKTLEQVRATLNDTNNKYMEQSVSDAATIFKKIEPYIKKPRFFHLRRSYLVIEVNPESGTISLDEFTQKYRNIIVSMVRFETEYLSEAQMTEIMESAIGYFRGDLIVIDTEASFVHDMTYQEILPFFEFANIQAIELQYFDKVLNDQLNVIYERKTRKLPWTTYLPFIGNQIKNPVEELDRVKVDISVITERLASSIKLAGEPYFSEIYELLAEKLDLKTWKESVDKKLEIVRDIRIVYLEKINQTREDLLNVLIIVLIFIEVVVAIFRH